MSRSLPLTFLFGTFAALIVGAAPTPSPSHLLFVGTYTNWEELGPTRHNPPGDPSHGIYAFRFDDATGHLTPLGLAAETRNPTFLAVAPSGRFLYAANELYQFNGEATGTVSSFAIAADTGRLQFLNQVAARGTGTCYVAVNRAATFLLAANFGSGSAAVFPLSPDGRISPPSAVHQDTGHGPNPRQAGPHAHAFNFSPDESLAFISEFGTDRLIARRLDPQTGALAPADPPEVKLAPGSAPRHLAFHPGGRTAYSVNEIDNTITVLDFDPARGTLLPRQTLSTLPPDFKDHNTAAEVVVHPSGRFLYASNRGHHSIAVFAIAPSGDLHALAFVPCGGRTPRGFTIDSTGRWLVTANQDTHNLAVFALDPVTGLPRPSGETAEVRSPVCVKFGPSS